MANDTPSIVEPTQNGYAPDDKTANISLADVAVERKPYQAPENILDRFLIFDTQMESAWISAGLSQEQAANARRVIMNEQYFLTGRVDIMADMMTFLAANAGVDRKAREDAIRVATRDPGIAQQLQAMMPQTDMQKIGSKANQVGAPKP